MSLKATAIVANDTMTVNFDGFAIYETGGTASATVVFRDGVVGGTILWAAPLTAGEAAAAVFPEAMQLNHASNDLYVQVTGKVEGSILSRVNTGI